MNSKEVVNAKIEIILPTYAIARFLYKKSECVGSIHISQITEEYVKNINDWLEEGKVYPAKILGYSERHHKWLLTLREQKIGEKDEHIQT